MSGFDDLGERGVLARLTVDEKLEIARPAILEFPHLDHSVMRRWLEGHGAGGAVCVGDSLAEKTDALLDALGEQVREGEDKEAIDRFIYGQVDRVGIEYHIEASPEEVARRDPLDIWKGVYDR